MHHDENDPRHSHHNRDMRHRREQQPNHERERYFNDFKSRWGEPSPPLNLHQNDWQHQDIGRFEREGQFHQQREEWLPNQRRQQPQRNENQQRDTSWRQRDVNFDRNNQRAENRWQQDDSIPHPDDSRRRRRSLPDKDGFRHDNNERDNRDRR